MNKLLRSLLLLLLIALLALAWTFLPARLGPLPELSGELPPATPPAGMSLSALPTGEMLSRAGLAYRGGSFGEERHFTMTPVLVRHPRGDLLFDTGFGRDVDAHVRTLPRLMQATTTYSKGVPVADQLLAGGLDPSNLAGIVLTHAHWDHVSGLDSLAGVPVWATPAEQAFISSGHEHAALARSLEPREYRSYDFDGGPYLGFPRSHDVWGDGSVVLAPAPGHTPGSVIAFITLPSGARYALLGDLVWQSEGVTLPAERPWLVRDLIGEDSAQVREGILRVAAIHQRFPQIRLLPAHDARAFAGVPVFPARVE